MARIGIIGGGNMGAAILQGIRRGHKVMVCEPDPSRQRFLKKNFKVSPVSLEALVKASDVLILAVKPQSMDELLAELREMGVGKRLVISIAAGMTSLYIEKALGGKARVIRTMPNMPAQIGEGVTAVCRGRYAVPADVRTACRIFDAVGRSLVVAEKWVDAITAVSGSGPAYVFLFIECLLNASRSLGLDAKISRELVEATLLGSVHQYCRLKEDPAVLRARVTSKGGTTQAATDVFMKHGIKNIFEEALRAACRRARELSRR